MFKRNWKVYGVDIRRPQNKTRLNILKKCNTIRFKIFKKYRFRCTHGFQTNIPKSILNPISYTKY